MIRERPRLLCLSGSSRGQSLNGRLAGLVARELALRDADAHLISLADYPMPIYDGDVEAGDGVPDAARKLRELLLHHQGVFIASPEYNHSLAPLLKNAIDWVSRIEPDDGSASPWRRCVFAIGAATPGPYAGIRGLAHLRQVLEGGLGAYVLAEEVAVADAESAFDARGGLIDGRAAARVERLCDRLIDEAARFS